MVEELLGCIDKDGERLPEAELFRLKGELLVCAGDPAEECLLKAIDVARQQGAKSFELRAALSLARLWQTRGQGEKGHALLAQVYGWFTEGFDTPDLLEAHAMLGAC